MKNSTPSFIACALAAALLSACGGDASDTVVGPSNSVAANITTNNQTDVARASVVGTSGVSQAQSTASTDAQVQSSAVSAMTRVRALTAAQTQRARALASTRATAQASGSYTGTSRCTLSGSVTVDYEDPDQNGLSLGDTMTVRFLGCSDAVNSNINGSVTLTFGGTSQNVGTTSFNQFVDVEGDLRTTVDGTFAFNIQSDSAAQTTTTLLVAPTGLAVSASSTGYTDTIRYAEATRFVETDTFTDRTVATTIDGVFSATSIGGSVTVKTLKPLVRDVDSEFPRDGQLSFVGVNKSTLVLTVIDATQVELQIDTNGDGSFESTAARGWTDLYPS